MTRTRKLLLSAVIAVGTLAGLTLTAGTASAQYPGYRGPGYGYGYGGPHHHPHGYGYGYGGYGPVYRPVVPVVPVAPPVVVAPQPVVVAPQPAYGFGGYGYPSTFSFGVSKPGFSFGLNVIR